MGAIFIRPSPGNQSKIQKLLARWLVAWDLLIELQANIHIAAGLQGNALLPGGLFVSAISFDFVGARRHLGELKDAIEIRDADVLFRAVARGLEIDVGGLDGFAVEAGDHAMNRSSRCRSGLRGLRV